MRANAAVDADDEFVAVGESAFECGLLNAVAFGETVRDVKAGACAEKFQCAEQDGGAGSAVDVVIAIDQHGLVRFDGVFDARDGFAHTEH